MHIGMPVKYIWAWRAHSEKEEKQNVVMHYTLGPSNLQFKVALFENTSMNHCSFRRTQLGLRLVALP